MYCPKCGVENVGGAGSCVGCGSVFVYQTQRTSGLGVASTILGIIGFNPLTLMGPFGSAVLWLLGLACGVAAIIHIKKSGGLLRGRNFAIAGVALSTAGLILGFALLCTAAIVCKPTVEKRAEAAFKARECGDLHGMSEAMRGYANEYDGQYPIADRWCDLLKEYTESKKGYYFDCWSAGEGLCDYAINPNCEPNSPTDLVLLFETNDGWNQFGGRELAATDNHKVAGCCVLFNSGQVEFVKPEEMAKPKWKPDRNKSESAE